MSNRRVVKETPQYKKVLHEKAVSQASTRPGTRLLILFVFQVTVHTCPLLFGAQKGEEEQADSSQQLAGFEMEESPFTASYPPVPSAVAGLQACPERSRRTAC
jgi:hypothetical protein